MQKGSETPGTQVVLPAAVFWKHLGRGRSTHSPWHQHPQVPDLAGTCAFLLPPFHSGSRSEVPTSLCLPFLQPLCYQGWLPLG